MPKAFNTSSTNEFFVYIKARYRPAEVKLLEHIYFRSPSGIAFFSNADLIEQFPHVSVSTWSRLLRKAQSRGDLIRLGGSQRFRIIVLKHRLQAALALMENEAEQAVLAAAFDRPLTASENDVLFSVLRRVVASFRKVQSRWNIKRPPPSDKPEMTYTANNLLYRSKCTRRMGQNDHSRMGQNDHPNHELISFVHKKKSFLPNHEVAMAQYSFRGLSHQQNIKANESIQKEVEGFLKRGDYENAERIRSNARAWTEVSSAFNTLGPGGVPRRSPDGFVVTAIRENYALPEDAVRKIFTEERLKARCKYFATLLRSKLTSRRITVHDTYCAVLVVAKDSWAILSFDSRFEELIQHYFEDVPDVYLECRNKYFEDMQTMFPDPLTEKSARGL